MKEGSYYLGRHSFHHDEDFQFVKGTARLPKKEGVQLRRYPFHLDRDSKDV